MMILAMPRRVRRVSLPALAVLGLCAGASPPANGNSAPAIETSDAVAHLIGVVHSACYVRGADPDGLRAEAETRKWKSATAPDLAQGDSAVSEMIAGWRFNSPFGSFTVMQSRFKSKPSSFICSVTTALPFDRHDDVQKAFEKRFGTGLERETDRRDRHVDRFQMKSPTGAPIAAYISYSPTNGAVTISLTQG